MRIADRIKVGKGLMSAFSVPITLALQNGTQETTNFIKRYAHFKKRKSGTQTLTLTHYGELLNKTKYQSATYEHLTVVEVNHVTDTKTDLVLSPGKRTNQETNKHGF